MTPARIVGLSIVFVILVAVTRGLLAFPDAKLKQVTPGMTTQEVEQLVGKSYKVMRFADHPDEIFWDYTRPLAFGYGGVVFHTNGIVKETHFEEM